MSTLLFLAELLGFVAVAHWAYVNDQARPSDAAKGLLRMRDDGAPDPPSPRKPAARWRRMDSRTDASILKGPSGRRRSQREPQWKRLLR